MLAPITFFDIQSGKLSAFSPNTWKVRYALNYKSIPYKTEWLDFPEIEPRSKELGVSPTGTKVDGSPLYTCPFIVDTNTGTVLAESIDIIEYLEKQYPDTPSLLPKGTRALQYGCLASFRDQLGAAYQFLLPVVVLQLTEKGQAHLRKILEPRFGATFEEVLPKGTRKEEEWAKFEQGFGKVYSWRKEAGGPLMLGTNVSLVDVEIAGFLMWFKKSWGEDSAEWRELSKWHDGTWSELLTCLKMYETIA